MRWIAFVLLAGCLNQDPREENDQALTEWQGQVTACPAGTWCLETSPAPSTTLLHAVWAINPNDVFAVGDSGTILRRTNDVWSAMPSGTTNNLLAVWGTSSSDVWASGAMRTLLHFDGTQWSPVDGATTDLNAIWGSSASDVWFVGQGSVLHSSGGSPSGVMSFGGTLLSVFGTSPSDVWVTGERVGVHHFDGSAWSSPSTGLGSSLLSVLAIAPGDVWVSAVVQGKETAHWDGARWTIVASRAFFNGMSAVGPSDVWGVGLNRKIGHWNGTAWTVEQPFGTSGTLWSVTTVPGHAWLVGDNNLIAHRSL